jgi:hypothetical protein
MEAELDATNRQVEILSDALAESRRERQWVGLTDEEIDEVTDAQWANNGNKPIYAAHRAYARAIEAKSKEQNEM